MISKQRSLRDFRNPIGCLVLLAAIASAAGCSTAQSPAGSGNNMNHVLPSGNSVSGWLVTPSGGDHSSSATLDYLANNGSSDCTQCHGSDLSGGISNVSCFGNPAGCHHGPVAGWVAVPPATQQHGVSAKKAPGSSGFASCQICHGGNFSGGGSQVSCLNNASCHDAGVLSPHPARPWHGPTYTHTDTNTSNATVCAQCHFPGSQNNPAGHPATPAPAGTSPGCFNSTLCHGEATVPHPVGSAWVTTSPAAQPHGNSAKATPGATSGFAYCQVCHGTGTNFSGGSSTVSCYPCHVPTSNSPHASQWRTGDTYVHTTTDAGNASVCAFCHTNGANSPIAPPSPPAPAGTAPGCFNSTLCHGAGGVAHPVPYNDDSHYTVTSATFPGSCSACHDVSAPTAKPGPACQTCHIAGSPLTTLNCTSCHASPPNGGTPAGAAYPNVPGAHGVHIALDNTGTPISCNTCHSGLGSGTLAHYNRANAIPGENALRVPPGDAAFLATYDAETGASSFDNSAALSCSNVSCHGGQTTPSWQTGTLDVNNQCTNCHVSGTSQYNSYNSGEHTRHLNDFGTSSTTCKYCHNTATLAVNHFTTLSTPAMEGPASATIGGAGTLITTWVPATQSCTPACHGTKTW
jgi:predicted CxxxxCH...CXXCH cytochrome family protein